MATVLSDVVSSTAAPSRPATLRGLIPTHIRGAYLSPAPAADFDPNTASPSALLKRGFFWRRPAAEDSEALKHAWNAHFGPNFTPGRWLVPEQVVQPNVVHRPWRRKIAHPASDQTTEETSNWGGCVLSGVWNSCQGSWTVPTVSQPAEAAGADGGWDSATWLGLDGGGISNDVLQAGTSQNVDGSGNATYFAWYEWYCAVQRRTLGEISPVRPALASLNNLLCMAWVGKDNQQLNVIVSSDRGQTFMNKHVSSQLSDFAPALCAHQGNLFIAWTGVDNLNVNIAQVVFDGNGAPTAIATPVVLNSISEQGPSLASLNGNLYVGFIGKDNQQINIVVSTDGGLTYPPQYKHISAETTPDTPALVAHQGQLFVGWKGDGNDQLNVANTTFNGPAVSALVNKQVLGDTSPYAPSLVSNGTTMYLAWRGDGNDQLNLMQSTDGVSFGGKYVSGETSTDAPVLAFYGADLFVGWLGDGNENLNASLVGVVNGVITGFSTPDYTPNSVAIPNFPVNPGDAITCSALYTADRSAGQVTISNTTQNVSFSITLVPPPGATMSGNTAEWVIEVPAIQGSLAHLPSFNQFAFTSATACGSTAGDAQNGSVVVIYNDADQPLTNTLLSAGTVTISYV